MTKYRTLRKFNETHLREEINRLLDKQEADDDILHPQVVALDICKAHREGLVDDEESLDVAFWMFAGYATTRKLASDCINHRDVDEDDEATNTVRLPQPRLPYDGFEREHLQNHYNVPRDGEIVGVPTRDLTNDEILAKADFHRRLSSKSAAHADELERYARWRRAQQSRDSTESPAATL
jgi:hypothetical protein